MSDLADDYRDHDEAVRAANRPKSGGYLYRTMSGAWRPQKEVEDEAKEEQDVLAEKERSVAEHIRSAAKDGCTCDPCTAAREAFTEQPI